MKALSKLYIPLSLIIISFFFIGFKPIESDLIIGKWQENTGVRTIEIYKKGNLIYGKILENKHADDDGLKLGLEMIQVLSY
jgi:hypothetical protein